MKAKLVKQELGYILFDEKGIPIGHTPNVLNNNTFSKLSLKNCQAIERGYDLDELARQEAEKIHIKSSHEDWDVWECLVREEAHSIKIGMVKMLELMGDKKFSDVNMEDAYYFGSKKCREEYLDFIKTFQQTEWDVEIEMVPALSNNGNVYYGDIPKLDADGCLILRRIFPDSSN